MIYMDVVFEEYSKIDMEYQALESEYAMINFLGIDFQSFEEYNPFRNVALEDAANSVAEAKVKNFMQKSTDLLKRIFGYIPKVFEKLGKMIKHNSIITKARANAGVPADLKEIPDDKLASVKKLRTTILSLKQKLLDAEDKRMQSAIKLSEDLAAEMRSIANIINVGGQAQKDVISGKFEVSKGKLQNMQTQFRELMDKDNNEIKQQLEHAIGQMKSVCENDRLFALAVPVYKGTDNTAKYTNIITQNSQKHLQVAKDLEGLIQRDVSVGHAVAKTIGKVTSNENDDEKNLNYVQRLGRSTAQSADLKQASAVSSSGVLELSKLYIDSSKTMAKIAKEYAEATALIFKVYPLPEGGKDSKHTVSDGKAGNVKASGLPGWFEFNGTNWVYYEEVLDKSNGKQTFEMNLPKERDKDKPPKGISKENIEEIRKRKEEWANHYSAPVQDKNGKIVNNIDDNARAGRDKFIKKYGEDDVDDVPSELLSLYNGNRITEFGKSKGSDKVDTLKFEGSPKIEPGWYSFDDFRTALNNAKKKGVPTLS